jgi:hypothetical protein
MASSVILNSFGFTEELGHIFFIPRSPNQTQREIGRKIKNMENDEVHIRHYEMQYQCYCYGSKKETVFEGYR